MGVDRGNLLLIPRDYIDDETTILAGGGWEERGASSLSNLKNTELTHTVQSNTTKTYIKIDFGRSRPVTALVIPKHNLSSGATWRIRWSNDSALHAGAPNLANLVYDNERIVNSMEGKNTPVLIKSGEVSIRVPQNGFFQRGVGVRLSAHFTGSNNVYLQGDVISYDSVTRELKVNVTEHSGTGFYYFWTLQTLSGSVSVWPEVEPFGRLPFGEYQWSGKSLGDDIRTPPAIAMMPYDMRPVRYGLLEIDDQNGPGFQELGKLIAGFGYQPSVNYEFGAEFGYQDPSIKERTRGGQVHIDAREAFRIFRFQLNWLEEAESMTHIETLLKSHGTKKPLFVSLRPDSGRFLDKYSMFGSLRESTDIQMRFRKTQATTFEFEEHN